MHDTSLDDVTVALPRPPIQLTAEADSEPIDNTRLERHHGIDRARRKLRDFLRSNGYEVPDEFGAGVTVVSLDSGIDQTHPDFENTPVNRVTEHLQGTRLDGRVAGTDGAGDVLPDRVGHGSFCASITSPISPQTAFVDLPIFGPAGRTSGRVVANAFDWVAENYDFLSNGGERAVLLGNSFGTTQTIAPLNDRLDRVVESGARDTTAAGNDGPQPLSGGSPATAELALSIGACTLEDMIAPFTSSNVQAGITNPDVLALGVNLRGARPAGTRIGRRIDQYHAAGDGTSFARPIATGTLAMVISALQPVTNLSPAQLAALVTDTARDLADTERDGAGILDAEALVDAALGSIDTGDPEPAPSPSPDEPDPDPDDPYSEMDFEDYVTHLMEERHGADNVRRQVRLSDGRIVDLLVEVGDVEYALELENQSYDLLSSRGQADHYATKRRQERLGALASAPDTGLVDHANVVPVVCVPAGTIDPSERATTQLDGVLVWEPDVPETVSLQGV